MTTALDSDRIRAFLRALGDELRQARKRRGWFRRDLQARLSSAVSLQTIATYELGTRHCTVARLLDLADALEVSMCDVLSPALERIADEEDLPGTLTVDLALVALTRSGQLEPLRRWAQIRLQSIPDRQPANVRLEPAALEWLAILCGIDKAEVVRQLRSCVLLSGHGL